jgi:hypothetical protein
VREKEKERKRKRQKERQKQRQKQRQSERKPDRKTDKKERRAESQTERKTERQNESRKKDKKNVWERKDSWRGGGPAMPPQGEGSWAGRQAANGEAAHTELAARPACKKLVHTTELR